jgi:hypothetical protein
MMTPANLGIVFSPNILQTPDEADVFRQFEVDSMETLKMELKKFTLLFCVGCFQNESDHGVDD